ncbi:hypothetical protein N303_03515, partial [Cuculus canorus]
RDMGQVRSIVRTLNCRKADFQLFEELLSRTPCDMVLQDKGAEHSWKIFKEAFHKAQEPSVPVCRKSRREGKRLVWLSRELLVKLKKKKELHRQCKQGQGTWGVYRDTARLCRDEVRKAKAQLELNLAREVKTNKKGFCRCINHKRKIKENVPPLATGNGDHVSTDDEKAEVLNNFFASVFTNNCFPRPSWVRGQQDGDRGGRPPPTVEEDQV